jgi:hypothetical protein
MFIKNDLRFNIHGQHEFDGVRYANLNDAALREQLGITEIPDPARGNDETEYTQELNEAPYIVITPKPAEMLARNAQAKLNTASLAYLASTDWQVIRAAEGGVALSLEVKALRQAARDAIVAIPDQVAIALP